LTTSSYKIPNSLHYSEPYSGSLHSHCQRTPNVTHFFFPLSLFLEYPLFSRYRFPCASKLPSFTVSLFPLCFLIHRYLHSFQLNVFCTIQPPPFGISLTRSLLNLYTSRTCINIMLLLNLSCVFTRMPQCGCRHSCRLGLMCNPSLCAESTYRGISKDIGCREKCHAHRTAVFAAVSEWNKPGKTVSINKCVPKGAKQTHCRIYHE
jgi:hypothetical protein